MSIYADIAVKPFRKSLRPHDHLPAVTARPHVVVIGAGIAGLAAALDLIVHGHRVTVLERAPAVGGKMRQVPSAGGPIDAGPTVFTMRWVFDALFENAGAGVEDLLRLTPAETLARHAWDGGQTLDLFADRERSADAIARFASPRDGAGYLGFCKVAARIYQTLEPTFIKAARPSPNQFVARAGVLNALRLKPFSTLWSAIAAEMTDPRLRQLFARYATYCGTSPYVAPATLMLVAHVEQEGVWLIEGGMHRLAAAIAALAEVHGAAIRTNAHVQDILVSPGPQPRVDAVRLDDGELISADAVIMNGEPSALAAGLLGPGPAHAAEPVRPGARSLSALTWAGTVAAEGLPLLRHNVFFSNDYRREFDQIEAGVLPTEPTVYVCAQDRGAGGSTCGPDQGEPERALVLVNAPANGDRRAFSQAEIDQCLQGMTSLLSRCGLRLRFTEPPVMTGPAQFQRLFPGSAGALYGQRVEGGFASFRRPQNRTKLPGLYLAGGSTHPGAGVPMAALSGRRAAAEVIEDLPRLPPRRPASTSPSPTAAMPGGTSMR